MSEPIDPALFLENERLAPQVQDRRIVQVGSIDLEPGGRLEEVQVAYETWGELNSSRSNAILVCHALSGDSHAVGWWDRIVGPGKALDTDRYFVIGTNALGGCSGSTGPSSLGEDGRPYGSRFPAITMGDMVEVQRRLLDQLGIDQLLLVAGGSMGGMQALEWTVRFPGRVRCAWATASAMAHGAMQIAFNEAARQAIMRDPKWCGGDYELADPPSQGLAVARMIGHLSYLSDHAFEAKFGRGLQDREEFEYTLDVEFQVESYLRHQAAKFTQRFDPNSLLVLTKAIDRYELKDFASSKSAYLFTSFTSDTLYPSRQSESAHKAATAAGCESRWVEVDQKGGHDSFLLDGVGQAAAVREFLEQAESRV